MAINSYIKNIEKAIEENDEKKVRRIYNKAEGIFTGGHSEKDMNRFWKAMEKANQFLFK